MNLEVNEFGQFYFKEVFEYSEDLSKLDYLELHQQLWNQMVKTLIEKNIYYEDEDILKEQALIDTEVNLKFRKNPANNCWCCEFTNNFYNSSCKNCLVNWGYIVKDCEDLYSPYEYFKKALYSEDNLLAAEEAAVIRDLPLREE